MPPHQDLMPPHQDLMPPHQDGNTVKSTKFEQNEKSSKKVKKVLDMVSKP